MLLFYYHVLQELAGVRQDMVSQLELAHREVALLKTERDNLLERLERTVLSSAASAPAGLVQHVDDATVSAAAGYSPADAAGTGDSQASPSGRDQSHKASTSVAELSAFVRSLGGDLSSDASGLDPSQLPSPSGGADTFGGAGSDLIIRVALSRLQMQVVACQKARDASEAQLYSTRQQLEAAEAAAARCKALEADLGTMRLKVRQASAVRVSPLCVLCIWMGWAKQFFLQQRLAFLVHLHRLFHCSWCSILVVLPIICKSTLMLGAAERLRRRAITEAAYLAIR